MEGSGFPRTLDRLLKLLGARAWLSEVIVTMTDAGGPYNLGGSATEVLAPNGDWVSRVGGLESKFGWGSGALDKRGMSWSCLCLGHRQGVCFGVPSWAILIRESPFLMVLT